jgi:hypothetical protein
MRPSRLILMSAVISAALPTSSATARSPFGVLSPIFGAVGHLLPHRHWHRGSHVSHAAARPTDVNAPHAEPNTVPMFWPQLADDLFDYVLWPSGNDDRFWAYGYNDIIEGALRPATREAPRTTSRAAIPAPTTGSVAGAPVACAGQGSETADSVISRISSTIQPTDAQRAALDDLHTAAQRAFDYIDKACAKTPPQTPTARLDAMEDRIWAARQALLVTRAPLTKLYESLSDEQKARLNGPSVTGAPRAAGCNEATVDLTRMLAGRTRPDPKQRPAIDALRTTSAGLARLLASSCPSALPATPIARLDAADRRLNAMLYAVATLRAPLDALSAPAGEPPKARTSDLRR